MEIAGLNKTQNEFTKVFKIDHNFNILSTKKSS